jgi:Na+/H+ antiporter NhaC
LDAAADPNSTLLPFPAYCLFNSLPSYIATLLFPALLHLLQNESKSNVRLLKLYESGLPGWAIWLPSYGLWYRPWMRRVTWLLFVLLSVVSMAMGFYDLYKNVPYFKQAIVAMFSPAAAVFEWLEHHTQVGSTYG